MQVEKLVELKEIENLESEIIKIETELKSVTNQLNTNGIATHILNQCLAQIEQLNGQLDKKSARWLELSELKEA